MARSRTTGTRSWPSLFAMIAVPVALLLVVLGFWAINRPDDCSAELLVNGRKLDVDAAYADLKLKTDASPTAQRVIGERLQFFMSRSAALCRDRSANRITADYYQQQQAILAQGYSEMLRMAASGSLRDVDASTAGDLATATDPARAATPASSLASVTLTNADGAILPSGATVHRGDRLKLSVDATGKRFVYILGVGSSGQAYRLFPSAQSSLSNPVEGKLLIPERADRFMVVGGIPGREQLHIFVSDKPDPRLAELTEITDTKKSAEKVRSSVKQALVVRDLFAERPTVTKPAPAKPQPVDVRSRYGTAAVTIELNNVG